ncbi:MAG: hypothetical protein U0V74_02750 [Chitinophagales bacterium]
MTYRFKAYGGLAYFILYPAILFSSIFVIISPLKEELDKLSPELQHHHWLDFSSVILITCLVMFLVNALLKYALMQEVKLTFYKEQLTIQRAGLPLIKGKKLRYEYSEIKSYNYSYSNNKILSYWLRITLQNGRIIRLNQSRFDSIIDFHKCCLNLRREMENYNRIHGATVSPVVKKGYLLW